MLHRNIAIESPRSETARLATARQRQDHIRNLENCITELAAHLDAATYRWLELVRKYDECSGWVGPGLKSCAHWLNWKCGIALGAASPGNESVLVDIALHGTAAHVERAVRGYRLAKRLEALKNEKRRHAARELHWCSGPDGFVVLRGRFTPDEAAVIRRALDAAMAQIDEEQKNVPAETSAAEEPSSPEPLPSAVASRRADALVRIAESWLAGSDGIGCSADHFVVNVHTDLDTLTADGCGAEAEIEGTGIVSAETSRRLACDAGVVHWLERDGGEPLSVGRKTRSVPPAIRRSLQRRDGGCRFPGCTATRFVDAHHIRHWADGGATHVENLVLLCRHHHRLVHEGGFGLSRGIGGTLRFTMPDGKGIPETAHSRFRGRVYPLDICTVRPYNETIKGEKRWPDSSQLAISSSGSRTMTHAWII